MFLSRDLQSRKIRRSRHLARATCTFLVVARFELHIISIIHMSRLSQYRRSQTILTGFLALMFLVGGAALTNSKGNYEWFPFYSWSMFALVPQEETNYRVLIQNSSGRWVDFRLAEHLVRTPDSLQAYHLIQKMGKALEAGQVPEATTFRHSFEESFLKKGTRYAIYRFQEDPLTIWKHPEKIMDGGDGVDGIVVSEFYYKALIL